MNKGYILLLSTFFVCIATIIVFTSLIPSSAVVFEDDSPLFPIKKPTSKPLKILAFGDLMLDRTVRVNIGKYGPEYPFFAIQSLFIEKDIIVANAEGVFTTNSSISVRDHSILRFTFATSTLPTLSSFGFTHLSQANNHTFDFKKVGQDESISRIEKQGMSAFGDYENTRPGPILKTFGSTTIAFVGFNEFSYKNLDNVLQAISKAKELKAFTIVYPHWGIEYKTEPNEYQKKTAHAFIDAGADVVIGSHPHVVQSIEVYKNHPIFYSMGNFIFDQAFMPEVREGIAVEINLDNALTAYIIHPFSIKDGQASLMDADISYSYVKSLLKRSYMGSTELSDTGFTLSRSN